MSRTTLREIQGLDQTPAELANSTLLLIDFQNTYTRGVMELDGWEAALETAARLLDRARLEGAGVVHVMHDGGPGTPYDIRAEIGAIHPRLAPIDGEPVVVKHAPDAFHDTDLDTHLPAGGDVVIAGWMTHMCVTFTAQGAFLRGHRPTVVAQATATRSLPVASTDLTADEVHHSALATITDLYGVVVASPDELR